MINNNFRVLQLGKFYPICGGVEKVAYDLMSGLSEQNVYCDMMCAATNGESRTISVNEHAKVICCHTLAKVAATMISPAMIFALKKVQDQYDIIHVHHPDPMACLALLLSGYKGKVVLHWHSDIQKQRILLRLYSPLQKWLIRRADKIVGTSPVYLSESPFLRKVQHKTVCLPIGVDPMCPDAAGVRKIKDRYKGKKIIFSLGRLVTYKGYEFLIAATKYLKDNYMILIGGTGALREKLQEEINSMHLRGKVKQLDINSVIDYFFVQELTFNDEYKHPKSVYMYIDGEDKLTAGPVWDFDWQTFIIPDQVRAYGGTYDCRNTDEWLYGASALAKTSIWPWESPDYTNDKPYMWYPLLFKDPTFRSSLQTRWTAVYAALQAVVAEIDRLALQNRLSDKFNSAMWPTTRTLKNECGAAFNGDEEMTFDQAIQSMKKAYTDRLNWMNAQIISGSFVTDAD